MTASISGIINNGNSGTVGEGLKLGVEVGLFELGEGEDVGDNIGVGDGVGVGDVDARARVAYAAPVGLTVKLAMSFEIIGFRVS